MHLRGNTEGYMLAASKHKKLRIHSGTHFHPFHAEEGRMDQLRWFDHWLKDIDTGIMDEPPVKLCGIRIDQHFGRIEPAHGGTRVVMTVTPFASVAAMHDFTAVPS